MCNHSIRVNDWHLFVISSYTAACALYILIASFLAKYEIQPTSADIVQNYACFRGHK